MTVHQSSPLYLRLKRHCASTTSLVIAFFWGLAEATLFFIVPDVYLGFVALFDWRKGLWGILAAVAGAMVGGSITYAVAVSNGASLMQLFAHIPGISAQMLETVAQQMQESGLSPMVTGPLEGIPYKIYAAHAGQQDHPFLSFLLMTVPARLLRFVPITLTAAAVGTLLRERTRLHPARLIVIYALLWLGFYLAYYLFVI